MLKVGFIGLGIMGRPMTLNLLKAGVDLTVYDISEKAVQVIADAGAKTAASPKEIAQNTDIIITMVPNAPIVKSLLEGDNGILAGIKENSIVIDK